MKSKPGPLSYKKKSHLEQHPSLCDFLLSPLNFDWAMKMLFPPEENMSVLDKKQKKNDCGLKFVKKKKIIIPKIYKICNGKRLPISSFSHRMDSVMLIFVTKKSYSI